MISIAALLFAEPGADERHWHAEAIDEDQRAESDQHDQSRHRLPLEAELFARRRAHQNERKQRDDEAGAIDEIAEQYGCKNNESAGFDSEIAERLSRNDERAHERDHADQHEERAQDRGEIAGPHAAGGAESIIAGDEEREAAEDDVDRSGPEVFRAADEPGGLGDGRARWLGRGPVFRVSECHFTLLSFRLFPPLEAAAGAAQVLRRQPSSPKRDGLASSARKRLRYGRESSLAASAACAGPMERPVARWVARDHDRLRQFCALPRSRASGKARLGNAIADGWDVRWRWHALLGCRCEHF